MADIATIWNPANGRGDWAATGGGFAFAADLAGEPIVDAAGMAVAMGAPGDAPGVGLVADRDLETAVLISLFTDAGAEPEDNVEDRRGWWGDASIGSRLWLRRRAKQTPATLALVKADAEAALAWLIEDGVASAVEVVTQWTARGLLGCTIIVRRTDGRSVTLAYAWAWEDR